MRLPRRAILIRILIYGPLLGYFGWRAYERYATAREAERRAAERDAEIRRILDEQSQTVTLPDGTTKQIPVITPEQARKLWGIEVPEAADADREAPGGSGGAAAGTDPSPSPGAADGAADPPNPGGSGGPNSARGAGRAPSDEAEVPGHGAPPTPEPTPSP